MPLLDESANGVFIIAATPFTDNGALDLESVDRMVDFYLDRGANGLTILGVMGEAPKLTERSCALSSAARSPAPAARRPSSACRRRTRFDEHARSERNGCGRGGRHGCSARPFAH